MATHLHLVTKLRAHGVIPLLPQHVCMSLCLFKHRDKSTVTFLFYRSFRSIICADILALIKKYYSNFNFMCISKCYRKIPLLYFQHALC